MLKRVSDFFFAISESLSFLFPVTKDDYVQIDKLPKTIKPENQTVNVPSKSREEAFKEATNSSTEALQNYRKPKG